MDAVAELEAGYVEVVEDGPEGFYVAYLGEEFEAGFVGVFFSWFCFC